jgi:hypothetical protein
VVVVVGTDHLHEREKRRFVIVKERSFRERESDAPRLYEIHRDAAPDCFDLSLRLAIEGDNLYGDDYQYNNCDEQSPVQRWAAIRGLVQLRIGHSQWYIFYPNSIVRKSHVDRRTRFAW